MIGERLKQARLGAGLSMDALVLRMGGRVSKQSISKYERGLSTPSTNVLLCISKALGLRTSYFFQERKAEVVFLAYRKHGQLNKTELNKLQFKLGRQIEVQHWLTCLFEGEQKFVADVTKPMIPPPEKIADLNEVEDLARRIRKEWQLGLDPIESVVEALEDRGAFVYSIGANAKFYGLSGWSSFGKASDRIPVLVTTNTVSGERQRFNLAHELGHLLTNSETIDEERVANRFAASFLAPDVVAWRELGRSRSCITFDELAILKKKYGLSIQAWLVRASDLGIVSKTWVQNAMATIRRRGWHKQEPGDRIQPEEPLRFKQMLLRALAEGIISNEQAKELDPDLLHFTETGVELSSTILTSKLPAEQRRKILQKGAELAASDYKKDKELTVFTSLDGAS